MPRFHEANKPKWVSVSVLFYVWLWFCCNKHLWVWVWVWVWVVTLKGVGKIEHYRNNKTQQRTNPWWRHQMETFSALLAICAGNSPVIGEFPSQRPVTRSFDVSLICARINGWVNNREAGDLRRHGVHYDVIVMREHKSWTWRQIPISTYWKYIHYRYMTRFILFSEVFSTRGIGRFVRCRIIPNKFFIHCSHSSCIL